MKYPKTSTIETTTMIDKILIISCEHQRYRRAGQIAALELGGYPLDKLEIIWGNHRNKYSDIELVDMLVQNGLTNHKAILDLPENNQMRYYSLSILEAHVRAFKIIASEKINAIILEDDILLKINYRDLTDKLEKLTDVVDVGICQLKYAYRGIGTIEHRKEVILKPVIDAPDFAYGSFSNSSDFLFVTSMGAEKILDYLSTTKQFCSIETHLPCYLYKEPWIFSVVSPESWHLQTHLQGDSIAMWHTEKAELTDRQPDKNIKSKNMGFIEKFRL